MPTPPNSPYFAPPLALRTASDRVSRRTSHDQLTAMPPAQTEATCTTILRDECPEIFGMIRYHLLNRVPPRAMRLAVQAAGGSPLLASMIETAACAEVGRR